ncbi:hypothetical protein [Dictyobacter alpinus]|nr:hypothetical protein [Dictyobacter alpinus]
MSTSWSLMLRANLKTEDPASSPMCEAQGYQQAEVEDPVFSQIHYE